MVRSWWQHFSEFLPIFCLLCCDGLWALVVSKNVPLRTELLYSFMLRILVGYEAPHWLLHCTGKTGSNPHMWVNIFRRQLGNMTMIRKITALGSALGHMTSSGTDLKEALQYQAGILCAAGLKPSQKSGLLSCKSHAPIASESTFAWQEGYFSMQGLVLRRGLVSFLLQQAVQRCLAPWQLASREEIYGLPWDPFLWVLQCVLSSLIGSYRLVMVDNRSTSNSVCGFGELSGLWMHEDTYRNSSVREQFQDTT